MKRLIAVLIVVSAVSFCGMCFGTASDSTPADGAIDIPIENPILTLTSDADSFDVLLSDVSELGNAWSLTAISAPEPITLILLALGGLALRIRRS